MTRYVLRRLARAVPLLFGIATLTFLAAHLAPGDPLQSVLERQMERRGGSAVGAAALRRRYGLDAPLPVQYVRWLGGVARGDLGESIRYHRPVSALVAERLPATLEVTTLALAVDVLLGIPLGIVAAVRRRTAADRAITVGALVLYAIPGFWLAVMLVLAFGVELRWLPTSQMQAYDHDTLTGLGRIADRTRHLVLPVAVLGLAQAAVTARYTRSALLEALNRRFVLAARARGVREHALVLRHALRNALLSVVTRYGMALPFLLGGSVLVEQVFSWPGVGLLAAESVQARDYPVILATSMLAAGLVVLGNLLADVGYALVDPRVTLDADRVA